MCPPISTSEPLDQFYGTWYEHHVIGGHSAKRFKFPVISSNNMGTQTCELAATLVLLTLRSSNYVL